MKMRSVVHRVLDIPEILELILSQLDRKSNVQNALVCKRWSDIALNLVWRDVTDLLFLFQLLAPLEKSGSINDATIYRFERGLTARDWERFGRYARRVRSFTYGNPDIYPSSDVDGSVFDEIARTRPPANILPAILPNLRSLSWFSQLHSRTSYSFMFMHENITKFDIYLRIADEHPLDAVFDEIRLRMPHLTSLDLRFENSMCEIEDSFIKLVSRLKKLKQIILPAFTVTTRVFEALSKLPNLRIIQFEFLASQGIGQPSDVASFSPRLEDGAFPSLFDLALNCSMQDATRLFNAPFAPIHMKMLYLHVTAPATPDEMRQFLTVLSENCQLLTHLSINLTRLPAFSEDAPIPDNGRVTWDHLKPVLSLPELTDLSIIWSHPFMITEANIEEMASKWPSLESLCLNSEPLDPSEESMLTLRALVPFARHCPKLNELGLYISTKDAAELSRETTATLTKPFKSLQRFEVGLSGILDPKPVALFLSQLCPSECSVESGVTWPDGFGMMSKELEGNLNVWWERWQEVDSLLPLLIQLRQEEREKRKNLEKEVSDLRMRCRVLEDMANTDAPRNDSCIMN
ncbi:hypothetical protein K474DRAFT_1723382 [Panus rudis PR-1116 ss-1]|nr:hypothetical protein K474DRAFT_1723382 [Panus rudis PR-1116 ss-1]